MPEGHIATSEVLPLLGNAASRDVKQNAESKVCAYAADEARRRRSDSEMEERTVGRTSMDVPRSRNHVRVSLGGMTRVPPLPNMIRSGAGLISCANARCLGWTLAASGTFHIIHMFW